MRYGALALFFYDLPEAVARIRFGDPDLGGYSTTGTWPWPHALDLFVDHADERLAHLPQADLHGQLLAHVLTKIAPYPLARLWYYAEAEYRTAGVFQSDGDTSSPEQFCALAEALERRNAAGTFYLMRNTRLTEDDVASLRARGHTFGPHIDPRAREEDLYFALPDGLEEETELFRARFGAVSSTVQCHCAPWPAYMSMVPAHVANRYRLLFAYLTSPLSLWGKYLCGSGRPMKFFDLNGTLHNCWQQPVVTYDDATLVEFLRDNADSARRVFDGALAAALKTHHTATPILSHPVSFCTYSRPVMEHCFDRLHDESAPIYSADAWLDFIDRRSIVRIEQARDDSGDIACTVSDLRGRIPLMVPAKGFEAGAIDIEVNGRPAEAQRLRRIGEDWLFAQLDSSKHGSCLRIDVRGLS
jgi:hypothetical protein